MIHSAEKNMNEFGDKVSAEEKTAIENDIKSLKDSMESDDLEKIKSGLEALTQSSMKLGEAMYKSQQAESAPEGNGSDDSNTATDGKNEKVVDAEFEEVKEDDTKQA
jgi:molecular chaperone DnaK